MAAVVWAAAARVVVAMEAAAMAAVMEEVVWVRRAGREGAVVVMAVVMAVMAVVRAAEAVTEVAMAGVWARSPEGTEAATEPGTVCARDKRQEHEHGREARLRNAKLWIGKELRNLSGSKPFAKETLVEVYIAGTHSLISITTFCGVAPGVLPACVGAGVTGGDDGVARTTTASSPSDP